MFTDRSDAGRQLARALRRFESAKPLILALPRGGVVLGAEIARALHCNLDVLLVKKLRAPDNPELALGAVSEDGHTYINEDVRRVTGADADYLKGEINERLSEIAEQRRMYRAVKMRVPAAGRTTILVDDGLATGATIMAAVQATALEHPQKLVVAVPVSSPDAARAVERMEPVDEFVCLATPDWFGGVGQFYEDFAQVSDKQVAEILKEFA